ncbi:MAG TPA: hypothetical protein VME68_06075 [Acidobacteriaceae bacterium]|nr:hypothetical protein [Acidobacteriaceae bacterium]
MKISVNLASRPYVELGAIYSRLRTWIAILAVLGVALWFLYRSERNQAEEKTVYVASVQGHVRQLENQEQSYQTLMRQPKDAAILDQSDYLNDLFRRKAFSWTATMTDLETVLPSGVQVLAIDPIVARDGHVTIRLRVVGARDRALELIRNLEKSKHFAQPRLVDETIETNGNGQASLQNVNTGNTVNFDIFADYRPLPIPVQAANEEKRTAEAEPATETAPAAAPVHAKATPRKQRAQHRLPAIPPGRTQQP